LRENNIVRGPPGTELFTGLAEGAGYGRQSRVCWYGYDLSAEAYQDAMGERVPIEMQFAEVRIGDDWRPILLRV
jgi:hypothetical protein